MRCLGVVDIDQSAVRNSEDKVQDPFDPMNTPALPGMTKEEIMDLMVEKMIQKGKRVDKNASRILEKLSDMVYKELNEEGDRNGKTN